MTRGFDWDKARDRDRVNRAKADSFDAPKVMKAKYNGTCPICQGHISKGSEVYYRKGAGVWHVLCPEGHHGE